MNHVTQPLISADISIFHGKSPNFAISRHADIDYILTFLESLKIFLINMVTIFMMSTKMATPDLLKTKVF